MSVAVGIGGVRRNAAAAVCIDGRLVSACEQERVIRVRQAGMPAGRLPAEALALVLKVAGITPRDVTTYGLAETGVTVSDALPHVRLGHHRAHAASAVLTSPFDEAVCVVCDRHPSSGVSVWMWRDRALTPQPIPWHGPSFATVYSALAEALGFKPEGDEHKVEALAQVGAGHAAGRGGDGGYGDRVRRLVALRDDGLDVDARFTSCIAEWAGAHASQGVCHGAGMNGHVPPAPAASAVAHAVQHALGEMLLEFLRRVRGEVGLPHLCLGGGLFFNTCFTTRIAESGIFDRVFVPVNPGNAGLAAGAALDLGLDVASGTAGLPRARTPHGVSPFLGPSYTAEEIKAVLDNCKLSYEYVTDRELIDRVVSALSHGQLVGWFQDRMEWGHRALGHRSILANPLAPFVLENLNVFLKGREPYRSYGVSVCEEDAPAQFVGPARSSCMEYEYAVRDPERWRHLLPAAAARMRVQTVGDEPSMFAGLLKAFGAATGVPVLVNTSFNGLHEPIVCTPRDAVRVFYGTGLDVLVLGRFILRK